MISTAWPLPARRWSTRPARGVPDGPARRPGGLCGCSELEPAVFDVVAAEEGDLLREQPRREEVGEGLGAGEVEPAFGDPELDVVGFEGPEVEPVRGCGRLEGDSTRFRASREGDATRDFEVRLADRGEGRPQRGRVAGEGAQERLLGRRALVALNDLDLPSDQRLERWATELRCCCYPCLPTSEMESPYRQRRPGQRSRGAVHCNGMATSSDEGLDGLARRHRNGEQSRRPEVREQRFRDAERRIAAGGHPARQATSWGADGALRSQPDSAARHHRPPRPSSTGTTTSSLPTWPARTRREPSRVSPWIGTTETLELVKSCSTVVPRTAASRSAASTAGSRLTRIALTVCRLIPAAAASSACDIPAARRSSRMRLPILPEY